MPGFGLGYSSCDSWIRVPLVVLCTGCTSNVMDRVYFDSQPCKAAKLPDYVEAYRSCSVDRRAFFEDVELKMSVNLRTWINHSGPICHHITLPVSWGFEVRTAPMGSTSHIMACEQKYFPHCGRAECQIFKLGRDNRYYLGEF